MAFLIPGSVTFEGLFESLILGTKSPFESVSAASLYTPPNDGQSSEVISLVPTPHVPILAPCVLRLAIRFSSRSLGKRLLLRL